MLIDFVLRKKRTSLDQFIALEIKQNLNVASCIRGMMKDACKVWLVRSSEDDLRSVWSLGIHPTIDRASLDDCIKNYALEFDVELAKNCITSHKIQGTNLSYTLF